MKNPFSTTPHRAVKTVSSTPSPRSIPSTSARKPNDSKPLPLAGGKAKRPCASCGKHRF